MEMLRDKPMTGDDDDFEEDDANNYGLCHESYQRKWKYRETSPWQVLNNDDLQEDLGNNDDFYDVYYQPMIMMITMTSIYLELDDGDELSKFFGALKERYNHGYDLDIDQKKKIEQYFEYRWSKDKN